MVYSPQLTCLSLADTAETHLVHRSARVIIRQPRAEAPCASPQHAAGRHAACPRHQDGIWPEAVYLLRRDRL